MRVASGNAGAARARGVPRRFKRGVILQGDKKPSYLKGAAILAAASVFVKIVGAVYKIPIITILGDEGTGYFQVTYNIYTLILTIATAGIPVALSRLVSSAVAKGNSALVKRYFSVALPAFLLIGLAAMLIMYFFADSFARMMNSTPAAHGIRVLAPAVFFVCIISVYRGYAQGFENMVPTAASQAVEVISKAAFGIAAAMWLMSMGYELSIVSAGAIFGVTIGLGLCVPLLIRFKRRIDRKLPARDEDAMAPGDAWEPPDGVKAPNSGKPPAAVEAPADADAVDKMGRLAVFARIMRVSIPITVSASFMTIMTVIDTSVVLGRLQGALGVSESEASALFGVYTKGLTIYNLPPALIVPVAVSIIPAIAAALAKGRSGEAGLIMKTSVKLANLLAMPAGAGIMVLAGPILTALYYDPSQSPETVALMTTMQVILGAASFFVCLQHVTTAILQATGYEHIALMTFPIGAALKIAMSYFLAGNPAVGIMASPTGTLACFAVISSLNIVFIIAKVKERPKFAPAFIKPLLCTAAMAGAAYLAYGAARKLGSGAIGAGRFAVALYMAVAIVAALIVYAVLIIVTGAITAEDLKLVPKGEKLTKLLRIR